MQILNEDGLDVEQLRGQVAELELENGRLRQALSIQASDLAQSDALGISQARLKAFMDNMPAEMGLKDLSGRYVMINRHAEQLYGKTSSEISGLFPHDIFPQHIADRLAAQDREVLEREEELTEEFVADLVDGRQTNLVTKFPIRNYTGELVGLGAIAFDITAQKRQEEALRVTESRYKSAERLAALGHWEWDEIEDRCSYCSEELARLHGYSIEDYLKTFNNAESDLQAIHPEDRERYKNVGLGMRERHAGYEIEVRLLRADGTIREIREVARPVFDEQGRLVRSVGYVQDVTEIKRRERALRESETLLSHAAQMADLGHWVWDIENDTGVFCSEYLRQIFSLSTDEFQKHLSSLEAYLSLVHADDRNRYLAAIRESRSKRCGYEVEFRTVTPAGEVRYLRERGEPIIDQFGRHTRTMGIIQDITKDKAAEDALRESEQRFRLLLSNSPNAIYLKDINGRYLVTNEQFSALYEVGRERVLGRTIGDFVAPDEAEIHMSHDAEVIETGDAITREFEVELLDGSTRTIEKTKFPVCDSSGAPIGIGGIDTDISERKQAEQARRQSETLLKTIIDHSPAHVYLKNLEGRFVMIGKGFNDLFGVEGGVEGKASHKIFPVQLADDFIAHDKAVIATGDAITRVFDLLVGSDQRSFLILKFPVRNSDGEISAIGAVASDITDSKRAEEALRSAHDELEQRVRDRTKELSETNIALQVEIEEHRRTELALRASEKRIRAIADALPSQIAYVDRDERYQFNNAAYEQWFGIPADECLGKTVREVIGEANYKVAKPCIERAFAGERFEFSYLNSQGRFAEVTCIPNLDEQGQTAGFYSLVHDITEAKRTEAALIESRDLLKAIIEAAAIGINVKGPDGRYAFMNRYQADVYGVNPDDAVGKRPGELVSSEYGAYVDGLDRRVYESGEALPYFEEETTDANGSVRSWLTTKVPVEGEGGALRYVVSVSLDVSELKAREQELRQAQKMDAVGKLTGGIAHDFNNLLFVIQGNLTLLETQADGDERLRGSVESIRAAATLGSNLTKALLAFSRQQPLDPIAIDLRKTVSGTVTTLLRTLGENIHVELSCDDNVWPVLVDRNQFENALLNLALNARDAMPDGGTLSISIANLTWPPNHRSADSSLSSGDYVELKVVDAGVGMEDDVANHCFEPFFTTKPGGSGTGLGLSMVYGFIKQSGGDIDIESEIGKGTSLSIYLPRSAPVDRHEDRQTSVGMEKGVGNETILVTEDDAAVRRVAVNLLGNLGYKTFEAENAEDALQILEKKSEIDLLFTDIVLPGKVNGRELAKQARQLRPDLKILYTTGYSRPDVLNDLMIGRDANLIQKPYRPERLAELVRERLDRIPQGGDVAE